MPTQFLKQSPKESKIFRKEANFQLLLRIISNKTQSISTSLESNLLANYHNQDFKVREIPESNHPSKLAPKYHLKEIITKVRLGMDHLGSFQANRKSNLTQDNHQQEEREATKDLQSTQEVPMLMLIKTKCTTVNLNTKHQVTKKTSQQTFHQDHK